MPHAHWIDPERIFDSVVVLADDAVLVSNPPEADARAIAAELASGSGDLALRKSDPTTIPVAGITRVRFEQDDDAVDLDYRAGKSGESKNIAFSTREERDAFVAQLVERLPACESQTVAWSPWRALVGPTAFGSVVGVLTWLFHAAAAGIAAGAEAEVSGRRSGLKRIVLWVIETIGPVGVLAVGGLLLAVTGFYAWKRFQSPPVVTTLRPTA